MRIQILIFSLFLSALASCQQNTPANGAISTVVSVEAAEQLLASDANLQILDVRTPEEHAQGHIKGCVLMDFYVEDFDKKLETLDPEKSVFVYCKSGGRSGKTAKKLVDMGFKAVYDLKGGMIAWEAAGKPVDK